MVIFHSYVSLPEGSHGHKCSSPPQTPLHLPSTEDVLRVQLLDLSYLKVMGLVDCSRLSKTYGKQMGHISHIGLIGHIYIYILSIYNMKTICETYIGTYM